VQRLLEETAEPRERLMAHPIYHSVSDLGDVQRFMAHHVFAVWDFMSLLKGLQAAVTCVGTPWRPVGDAAIRRFINEIVVEEESDEVSPGRFLSHFEFYLEAMAEAGADRGGIDSFLTTIEAGATVSDALAAPGVPPAAASFVRRTWGVIAGPRVHCAAASFAFARESIIPGMFEALVARLADRHPGRLDALLWYLRRHIEIDGEHHHDLAIRLASALAGDDDEKWAESTEAVRESLDARVALWDAVMASLQEAA
jgi:pyrroloquinoline quinone (PQQ) biosynthesis protein C